MKSAYHKLLLGSLIAATFAAGPAEAALRLSDAFDGAWGDLSNAHGEGRGWVLDVISGPDGRRVLFISGYLYDNDGKPLWVTASPGMGEFEYSATADLVYRTGGTFDGAPGEKTTPHTLGSATIEFANCSEATLSITPVAGSGFKAITYNLTSLQQSAAPAGSSCVYKKKFADCPTGTTAAAAPRTCILTGNIKRDLTLTNDTTWELEGLVTIGGDNANSATLSIEPGTLVTGSGNSADYLYVNPGSKIYANGTPYAPIVFTSPRDGRSGQTPAPGDWGGIVLSGNAPNNKCRTAPFDCRSEFDSNLRYGGDNPHDSSGSLRYVQSRYAGYVFVEGREVNSFTFQSVGDGTVLEYLQSYRGKDDGFEWFGGTVNAKYLVSYEGGDDGFDWDEGWSGKVQFAFSKWADSSLALGDDNGFESSNQADNHDASPRATPRWSNVTLIGNGNGGGNGIHLKEGTAGHLSNILVTNFNKSGKSCLHVDHAATAALVGGTDLTLDHIWLNCAVNVADGSKGVAGKAQALFDAGAGNKTGNPQIAGFLPAAGSPLTAGGRLVGEDSFFTSAPYIGAFRDANDDWTVGWTHYVQR